MLASLGDSGVVFNKQESTNTHSPTPAPTVNFAVKVISRTSAENLAAEEAKRKARMGIVVKLLYEF